MSYEPDYELKSNRHFQTRAVGALRNPIQRDGYVNNTLKTTANGVEFSNSESAERFLPYFQKKYDNTPGMCRSRNLKMISKNDSR
jgi:hypothetical protein